jgi:hypothetical protein
MARRSSDLGSALALYGTFFALGMCGLIYEEVTDAWKEGDYGPALIVGAVVATAAGVAGAVHAVREYGYGIHDWRAWREKRARARAGK